MNHCRRYISLTFLVFAVTACTSIEGGDCAEGTDDTQWYLITQTGATGTLKKCVMCNYSLEPGEIEEWITTNAGADYLAGNPDFDEVLPCLYVYGPGPFDSEMLCKAVACGDDPVTNDAVHQDHHAGRTSTKERTHD